MSTKQDIYKFIQDTLQTLLDSVCEGFDVNELAFLSSQGKNELQIRDKIAWRLQNEIEKVYKDRYVVCREWGFKGDDRAKVDLAVLELNTNKDDIVSTIALIEFKAQSIVKREKWYLNEFEHDLKKMKVMAAENPKCKEADMYFVFLETGQEKPVDKFKPIIAYSQYLTKSVKYRKDSDYLTAIQSHWEEFNKRLKKDVIHAPKAISIGEAFGCEQYISPLIIGPLKSKHIDL